MKGMGELVRTKNKSDKYSSIKKAAKECFLENGYSETTIRDIADRAEVSPGTIYSYFKSKKELFDSLNIPEMKLVRPEYERKRSETLKAALVVFGEKGFDGTTMDEIANAVGISKATLYLYFDSKEDLFAQVLRESSFNTYSKKIKKNVNRNISNWEEDVKEIGRSYLQISNQPERIALFRSVIRDSAMLPEMGALYYEQGFNAACQDVVQYLKNVRDAGIINIKDADLSVAVHTYFASLQSYILMNNVISGIKLKVSPVRYLDITTKIFIKGIKQYKA
jgi:TetR/AcrR family transcriptional repressor of mexJK operon